ncbi:septal ring lytic transglycosylase RlpA family protein [Pseudanabaena biceps]|nr:septal ring lytic transglycosylase RlpA family protein [Pseudanabaena biceps]
MTPIPKLLVLSLLSLASTSSVPILVNEVTGQTINQEYQSFEQEQNLENSFLNKNSLGVSRPRYTVDLRHNIDDQWMIFVNNKPTFWVKDLPQAALAVAKVAIILNLPDFDPDRLKPSIIDNEYVGKYQDTILFKVSKASVLNPSLNLTQWINNLRVAADTEPLTLVEAQKQMYQLSSTGEQMNVTASWYGPYFQGRQTASGEQFEQEDYTAAHPTLPFDTYLKVTNQQNGKSVVVRINDRGPYVGDRSLDLSYAAAIALSSNEVGVVPVTATILSSSN